MNPKLKILIRVLILGILVALGFILVSHRLCVDSYEQCAGKADGTSCTSGVWCDLFGRVCGGRSCVGLGMSVCLYNKCVPGGVALITDKAEYKRGETVKVAVRNGLDRSVWYFGGCGSPQFWGLQKLDDSEWQEVNFFLPDLVEGEEVCDPKVCERQEPIELGTYSAISHDWRQGSICEMPLNSVGVPEIEPEFIEEGTYRIYFTYGLSKDEEGFGVLEKETIYSEFTIK